MERLKRVAAWIASAVGKTVRFLRKVVENEPVIIGAVRALALVLAVHGVPINDNDVQAIVHGITYVLAFVSTIVARRKVTPNKRVKSRHRNR